MDENSKHKQIVQTTRRHRHQPVVFYLQSTTLNETWKKQKKQNRNKSTKNDERRTEHT